jgi:Vitamin K-dependent gamma-carboxylase
MSPRTRALRSVWLGFNDYLFSQARFDSLGLMRLLLCGTLFYMGLWRHLVIDHFSEGAMIPRDLALTVFSDFYRPSIAYFFWPDSWAPGMHLLLVGLLFLAFIGMSSRPLMLLTWLIYQGFVQRNFSIQFGADLIGGLFLFYLSFTRCCESYTIQNCWRSSRKKTGILTFDRERWTDQVSSVFFRLMQIQIAVIYMYTGFEKLKGGTWWDGTALWTVFANPQFAAFDFIWLRHFPLFFAVGTFTTIMFEVYFPALIYFRRTRYFGLALGVLFHVLIGVTLGLMPFSLVMMSTYFLFLDRLDLRRLRLF